MIRSAFPGRLDAISIFRFFPGAKRVAERFPSVEATARAFATAGFHLEHLESVPQVTAPSLRALLDRVRMRADTTLQSLGDDEFAQGIEALENAAAKEKTPVPVVDRLDLLVLRSVSGGS